MATDYWNGTADTAGTTDHTSWTIVNCCDNCTATVRVCRREILVEHPEKWSEEDHKDYINLVNSETKTGWRGKMLIRGDIKIIDPNIEVRSMRDFIPLLKDRASAEDKQKIDDFFQEHNP